MTAPQTVFPLRSSTGVALVAATVLASTVGFLNAYMINVAVPAIGRDLAADVSAIQWVLTGYLVTVAALLLLAGALADHFGRRRILVVGLFVMLAAALGCAAAPNAAILIVARLVQGVGGALVVPSSLAMLNGALVPVDRARGIGIWAGLSTLGTTIGPYAGGWLVDHASWRYIFLLNVPLVLAAYWALRSVPEVDRSRRPLSLDVPGALLAVAGLGAVIYAMTAGPASGWGSGPVLTSAVVGVVCLVALVPVERRQRQPIIARVGIRWPMAAGILLTAGAFCWLSAARVGESYAQAILPGAVLWGLGIGVAVAPLTAGVLAAVEDTDLGAASAINDASSRVGGVVMVALVPALLGAGDTHSLAVPLAAHYQTAMLAMAGLSVAAAVITAVYVTRSLPPSARRITVTPRIHGCAVPEPITATSRPSGKRTSP